MKRSSTIAMTPQPRQPLKCLCNKDCDVKIVTKDSINNGKHFATCPFPAGHPNCCKYFAWAPWLDDDSTMGLTQRPKTSLDVFDQLSTTFNEIKGMFTKMEQQMIELERGIVASKVVEQQKEGE